MSDNDKNNKKMPANQKGKQDKDEQTHEDEGNKSPPVPPTINATPTKPSPPPSPFLQPGETPYSQTPAASSYSNGFVSKYLAYHFVHFINYRFQAEQYIVR